MKRSPQDSLVVNDVNKNPLARVLSLRHHGTIHLLGKTPGIESSIETGESQSCITFNFSAERTEDFIAIAVQSDGHKTTSYDTFILRIFRNEKGEARFELSKSWYPSPEKMLIGFDGTKIIVTHQGKRYTNWCHPEKNDAYVGGDTLIQFIAGEISIEQVETEVKKRNEVEGALERLEKLEEEVGQLNMSLNKAEKENKELQQVIEALAKLKSRTQTALLLHWFTRLCRKKTRFKQLLNELVKIELNVGDYFMSDDN